MRITRLYHTEKLQCGEQARLDANASSHLVRVLRSKPGTPVTLFNGDGFDYRCRTLDSDPKRTLVSIESRIQPGNESNISITLIQGLSRQDRMEATIQKSVELGVNKIIPVICQRSNHKLSKDKMLKKLEHWRKVVVSACEQSGRSVLPDVLQIIRLSELDTVLDRDALKLNLDPEAQRSLKEANSNHQEIEIFIGPEGGLNDDEKDVLNNVGFESIRFGPRVLRTETAGPAVISAVQILWGDF